MYVSTHVRHMYMCAYCLCMCVYDVCIRYVYVFCTYARVYVWFIKCKVSAGSSKWRLVYELVSVDSVSWYSLLRRPCVIVYIIRAVITILSLACIFI